MHDETHGASGVTQNFCQISEADCAKIVLVHAPDCLLHIEHGALSVASMLI